MTIRAEYCKDFCLMCAHIPEIAPKLQASAICDSLSCNKPPENMTFVGQHLDFHAAPRVSFVHTDAASQEKKNKRGPIAIPQTPYVKCFIGTLVKKAAFFLKC